MRRTKALGSFFAGVVGGMDVFEFLAISIKEPSSG